MREATVSQADGAAGTAKMTDVGATRRGVLASLATDCIEIAMLGVAAWVTGSVALRSQVAAAVADVAVQVFMLIGVLSSARPSDENHPLGYGRERFFWSFLAALGIFVGGGGFALEGAIRAALHPSLPDHYTIASRGVSRDHRPRRIRLEDRAVLRHSTDPAATTVVVGGGSGVIGGLVTIAGLVVSQTTRSATPDTVASMLIGMLLLGASAFLLHNNRELLAGRGVPLSMSREMRGIVAAQPGVVGVPDLFAIVLGASSLIVNGDIVFDDDLDVPDVEDAIMRSAAALGDRWPAIDYVYLTPVPNTRFPRGAPRFRPISPRDRDPARHE